MKDLHTSNKMHRGLDKNKVSTKFHKKCSVYKHNLNQLCILSWPSGQGCKVLMKIWILNMCCSVVMLPENGRLLCIWMIDDAPLKYILAAHIKYSAEFQHSQHHHCPEQWCTWPIINKYIQQCTVESWTAATIIIIRQLNRLMNSQQYHVMHCLSQQPQMFVSKLSCLSSRA